MLKGCRNPNITGAVKGDSVYLKEDGGKHNLRELYVVISSDDQSNFTLVKLLHAHDNTATTKLGSKKVVVIPTDALQKYVKKMIQLMLNLLEKKNLKFQNLSRSTRNRRQPPGPLFSQNIPSLTLMNLKTALSHLKKMRQTLTAPKIE